MPTRYLSLPVTDDGSERVTITNTPIEVDSKPLRALHPTRR